MSEHDWARLLGYALQPIFWIVALSCALWIVRRVAPQWERTLFDPVTVVARRWWQRYRSRPQADHRNA